jgi:hypothetical protein
MTRREFDSETKENWGCRMASDERCHYFDRRRKEHRGSPADGPTETEPDYIVGRAEYLRRARLNRALWEPVPMVFYRGFPFFGVQQWKARNGRTMLRGNPPRW